MTPNAIEEFLEALQELIVIPLRNNQARLSRQKTLLESPKYQEIDNLIREMDGNCSRVKDTREHRNRIWEILRKLKSKRMTQFFENGRDISPNESAEVQETLKPYLALLEPVESIWQLQLAMANQAKLKKMPLPYDEITATLSAVADVAAQLPQALQKGVLAMWQCLEQVA